MSKTLHDFIVRIVGPVLLLTVFSSIAGCGETPSGPAPAPTPDSAAVDAALRAAESYRNTNDVARAEAILARLIEKAPREWRARELMGQVLSQKAAEADRRGDPASALLARDRAYRCYREAVEIHGASAGLQQSAGVMAMVAGEEDAALEHFRRAAVLDPTNPQHPLYAAQVFIAREAFGDAETMLLEVLVLDPDEPAAHASLAVIALETNRTEEARRSIAEARAIAPGDLRFRLQEAMILRRTGDAERAVDLLAGLPAETRADTAVAGELAAAFTALGRHESAGAAWALAFDSSPRDPAAYRAAARAGHAYLRAGLPDEAAAWLARARSLAGDAPEVRNLEAELLERE